MSERTFYDIHCHAMNMSHPYMMAFVARCVRSLREITMAEILKSIRTMTKIRIIRELLDMAFAVNETRNLISVLENDVGGLFLIMEECLSGVYGFDPPFIRNGKFRVGGCEYDKIVLTPLMMDFEYRAMAPSTTYYSKPAQKPLSEQIIDVFNGIAKYIQKSEIKIFEIYPFFGINTRNYTREKIAHNLEKYFSGYKRSRPELKKNLGTFRGSLSEITPNYFAGIKVYPPLGFDPWPHGEREELEKVRLLYAFCEEKRIPITAHCNDEGFTVCGEKEALLYTSPERWSDALAEYPGLILNLAHFGRQSDAPAGEWARRISQFMMKYDHVYSDFAFNGVDPNYYEQLRKFFSKAPSAIKERLYQRILFGSDFMMSLLKIESYSLYMKYFSETPYFTAEEKNAFGSVNPSKFLFGR